MIRLRYLVPTCALALFLGCGGGDGAGPADKDAAADKAAQDEMQKAQEDEAGASGKTD